MVAMATAATAAATRRPTPGQTEAGSAGTDTARILGAPARVSTMATARAMRPLGTATGPRQRRRLLALKVRYPASTTSTADPSASPRRRVNPFQPARLFRLENPFR